MVTTKMANWLIRKSDEKGLNVVVDIDVHFFVSYERYLSKQKTL